MTVKNFACEWAQGHIVLVDGDRRLLIDTGSPISIAETEEFEFAGETHPAHTDFLGMTIAQLSRQIGTDLNALVGTDVLQYWEVLIDMSAGRIGLDRQPIDLDLHLDAVETEMTMPMAAPVLQVRVGGASIPAFFDTGAPVSYAPERLVRGLDAIGEAEDFYPVIGDFSTPLYDVEVALGPERWSIRMGVLPEAVRALLSLSGTDCILGTSLLQTHRALLGFPRGRIAFQGCGGQGRAQ
ncbi:MAG: hypothetical protein ISN29_12320 [Gammaproteobacteria bacterium AqS3]|nr:hypothetical protein [Gammaproteobacteria bacterium AqS3]